MYALFQSVHMFVPACKRVRLHERDSTGVKGALYTFASLVALPYYKSLGVGGRDYQVILSLSVSSSASLSFFVSLLRACVLTLFSLCLSCSLLSLKHTNILILVLFLSIFFSSFYSHGRSRGAVYKDTYLYIYI